MKPPLEGSAIQAFMNVDKEWQIRGRSVLSKQGMMRNTQYQQPILQSSVKCQALIVILKRVLQIAKLKSSKNSTTKNWKGNFKFSDKNSGVYNSDFCKVHMSARLLLRQIWSMISSYFDSVRSEEDKTEALETLEQLFNSMADVTSRVIVTAVGARRNLKLYFAGHDL
jgi:hypothetical protein